MRNNLWDWQSLSPSSGPGAQFFDFCDALEVDADGNVAPESGFGAEHTLKAWASYWNSTYLNLSKWLLFLHISYLRNMFA